MKIIKKENSTNTSSFDPFSLDANLKNLLYQKQSPRIFLSKMCSKKFCQIHRKTPVPESLFLKRPWCRCFPVNFTKFLRTSFLIEHLWWLLLFIDGAIPLRNFKKNVPLLTRDFFSQSFQSCKFFHERVSCVKKRA